MAAGNDTSNQSSAKQLLDRLYTETVGLDSLINVLRSADLNEFDDNENGLLKAYCEFMLEQLDKVQDTIGELQGAS